VHPLGIREGVIFADRRVCKEQPEQLRKRTTPRDSPRRPQQEYLLRPWGNNHSSLFPLTSFNFPSRRCPHRALVHEAYDCVSGATPVSTQGKDSSHTTTRSDVTTSQRIRIFVIPTPPPDQPEPEVFPSDPEPESQVPPRGS